MARYVSKLLILLCGVIGVVLSGPQQYTVDRAQAVSDYGVQTDPASIIFDSKKVIVNPGESLSLDCGVAGDYRYCHWDTGKQRAIQVQDVYDGFIEGLSKPPNTKGNECGIIIDSVTIEDHGSWTCKVFVIGQTLRQTKNVTVTIRPTSPVLEVSRKPLIINEGDHEAVSCAVAAARPKVTIKWYLGDEDVTYHSNVANSLTDNMGTYKSISTLSHEFHAWHNNKVLRCLVFHHTLETPLEDHVDVIVRYKPFGQDVREYGLRFGDDIEAKLNFSSNPIPTSIKWGYGQNFETITAMLPIPGEEHRYSTEMVTVEEGHYTVMLRVLGFDESDAMMSFKIAIENELGVRDFRITLSNDQRPNEPLSSGTLAAIVIIVLMAILLLVCAVYLKVNRLFCFAERAESKAYIQDTHGELPGYQHTMTGAQNEGIKVSTDQINGNMDKPTDNHHLTYNGNGKSHGPNFSSVLVTDNKINTDV